MKAPKGQGIVVIDQDLDIGDFEDEPQRPDDSTLTRVSYNDLLPPPIDAPVALDFEPDSLPEYVKEQRIEFLLIQRKEGASNDPWTFPTAEVIQTLFDHVCTQCDHDQIFQVCLWTRKDPKTGIASIMLSTLNLQLMQQVRHQIRTYTGHMGYKLETYSKSQ